MKSSQVMRRTSGMATRKCICAAALISLAAVMGHAQTVAGTELPGLVPPAVANGAAAAAGAFNSNQMLRLVFGLRHPHMADEEQFLVDLNTKGSPGYRHFLTADEWNARFSPSAQDEQAVVNWAQAQGLTVTQRFANRLLVDVEAPVSAIEAALGVKINSYAIGGAELLFQRPESCGSGRISQHRSLGRRAKQHSSHEVRQSRIPGTRISDIFAGSALRFGRKRQP